MVSQYVDLSSLELLLLIMRVLVLEYRSKQISIRDFLYDRNVLRFVYCFQVVEYSFLHGIIGFIRAHSVFRNHLNNNYIDYLIICDS